MQNIFTKLAAKYDELNSAVRTYLAARFTDVDAMLSPSSVIGQLFTVVKAVSQNLLYYIDYAAQEQNIQTAQYKRSVIGMAQLTGYSASSGHAASCHITVSPNTQSQIYDAQVVIPDRTRIISTYSGLTFNIISPTPSTVLSLNSNRFSCVEGEFKKQTFISTGGPLWSCNVIDRHDIDFSYIYVYVNGLLFSQVCSSLYDMPAGSDSVLLRPSLKAGFDLVFGDSTHGRELTDGDYITVEYLIHSGAAGNIPAGGDRTFTFSSELTTVTGESVDANSMAVVRADEAFVTSGADAEKIANIKNHIGENARCRCLVDTASWKTWMSQLGFIGFADIFPASGSLVVSAVLMRNLKSIYGSDPEKYISSYEPDKFALTDEEKAAFYTAVADSGASMAGSTVSIIDPVMRKYAIYIYVHKDDKAQLANSAIEEKIRQTVCSYFITLAGYSKTVSKSKLISLIHDELASELDSIDMTILSEYNETAKIEGRYTDREYTFDEVAGTYKEMDTVVYLTDDQIDEPADDPNLGLDEYGSISLANIDEFPVLAGNWYYTVDKEKALVSSPLSVVFI